MRMTALAVLAALLAAPAAAAAQTPAQAPAEQPAYVRLAHLSPDTPQVDVYVDSVSDPSRSFVVPGVGYGAVSDYRAIPADSYVVSMRGAGADADSPPVISATLDAQESRAYTVAGVGLSVDLGLTVIPDDLEPAPEGRADVRVINAALTAPTVDVALRGQPVWAAGVRFGTATPYTDVPVGEWVCEVTPEGGDTVRLPVTLDASTSYTVLLVDRGDGLTTELYRDSTGNAVVPAGGVATGGRAPLPGAVLAGGIAAAAALALLAAVSGHRFVRR